MAPRFFFRSPDRDQVTRLPADRLRIEGYHLLQALGATEDGAVYRAVRLPATIEVALKALSPDHQADEHRRRRFLHRGQATRRLNHPHLVPCYDVGVSHGTPYYVVELDPGLILAESLQDGVPVERARALAIALDLAQALEAVHQEDLCHGNLHPGNVHLGPADAVRLGELALPPHPERDALSLEHLLRAGGTLAPECWQGQDGDIRADLFALGALLVRLVSGVPLHGTRVDEARHHCLSDPTNHPALNGDLLPPGLVAVLRKALAAAPANRYATPSQLREDLERLQYDFQPLHATSEAVTSDDTSSGGWTVGTAATPPAPSPPHPLLRRSPVIPVLAAIAVLGLAAGVAAVLWTRTPAASPPASHATPVAAPVVGVVASPPASEPPAPVPIVSEPPPAWSADHGKDGHGRWADLVVNGVKQRLRWCPAGTFWMGSQPGELGRGEDETRVLVTLTRPFWLADTEVTQELWRQVTGANPSRFRANVLPVETVDWHAASDFCSTLAERTHAAVRLPSEAEWEHACRAGATTPFSSDGPSAAFAWLRTNAAEATHPVASLAPNAWGLYDMHGNVLEWCADSYGPYPSEAATDPHLVNGIHRVARGGAWTMEAEDSRSAARRKMLPVTKFFFVGLRILIE